MENKVLIIGGDHHNTLGVIRCFGKEKIETKILIHGEFKRIKDIKVSHSKYSKNINKVSNNCDDIIKWLLNNKEKEKMIIIPCSDLAEYTLDKYYNKLNDYYIIPGFKNKPGEVCRLMDKYEQKKWSDKNDIPMAKTWSITIDQNNNFIIPNDIVYPCIVKPEISAFGFKSDIKIVKSEENLKNVLNEFGKNQYEKILIQQFLNKKYEICACGCIVEQEPKFLGCVIKKVRENCGSSVFGQFINEENIIKITNDVIKKIYNDGYRGLYDVEFLICEDNIYLNEINFRNSGIGYSLVKNGINAPYIYYLDSLNIDYPKNINLIYPNGYFIEEIGELKLLLKKHISFKEFISDIKKAFVTLKFDKNDILGSLAFFKGNGEKRNKVKNI